MNVADGTSRRQERLVSRAAIAAPAWELAVRAASGNRYVLEPTTLDGTPRPPSASLIAETFTWTHDGASLVYMVDHEVRRRDLASGHDRLLFRHPEIVPTGIAVSADDHTIYFTATVGRVQRQIMTNFGERPPLR
jgi:hypothetical protein